MVERSRKSRSTPGLYATQRGADELRRRSTNSSPMNEGNFPLRKASRTRKTRKESRYGSASFAPLVAPSRACPEMAPQRLEKIESAPENGMVSEASKPQHLVHGRAADRALRRNSLGPPSTARRPQFTNSKQGGRWEIFRLATPEIAQTGKESRRRSGSVATVYEFDARERRAKKRWGPVAATRAGAYDAVMGASWFMASSPRVAPTARRATRNDTENSSP